MNPVRSLLRLAAALTIAASAISGLTAVAMAEDGREPTAISVGVPDSTAMGEPIYLQALLIDSAGAPLPDVPIVFTSPAEFLNSSGDVDIAKAITNDQGLAVAEYQPRRDGSLTIQAEFRGNERYEPVKAAAQLTVTQPRQLYEQSAGVEIPGLSSAPQSGPLAGLIPLWPAISGWPIAMVLLIVWSLYLTVVMLMFRIVRAGGQAGAGRAHADSLE